MISVNSPSIFPLLGRYRGWALILLFPFILSSCASVALPDPQGGATSLLIGSCEFHWIPRGGSKKGGLEMTLEELVSGSHYQVTTDTEGYYFISNAPPGVYMIDLVKFSLSDGISVEYQPDVKLFIISPGKVHYLGRLVVEVDRSDLRNDFKYHAYEKFIAGDLRAEEIKRLVAGRRGTSGWLQKEISAENDLEKF